MFTLLQYILWIYQPEQTACFLLKKWSFWVTTHLQFEWLSSQTIGTSQISMAWAINLSILPLKCLQVLYYHCLFSTYILSIPTVDKILRIERTRFLFHNTLKLFHRLPEWPITHKTVMNLLYCTDIRITPINSIKCERLLRRYKPPFDIYCTSQI